MKDFPKRDSRDESTQYQIRKPSRTRDIALRAHDRIDALEPLLELLWTRDQNIAERQDTQLRNIDKLRADMAECMARIDACKRNISTLLRNLDAWSTLSANDRAALETLRGMVEALDRKQNGWNARIMELESQVRDLQSDRKEDGAAEPHGETYRKLDQMGHPEPQYVWRYRDREADSWFYRASEPIERWRDVERCMVNDCHWETVR